MSQKLKKVSGSRVSFSFSVEEKEMKKAKKRVLENFRVHVSVKGFRKGQVPDDVIESQVGSERIFVETVQEAIDGAYRHFLAENGVQPINTPQIDVSDPKNLPIEVKGEVEVFPEVSLGNYKKIDFKKPKIEVSEKEIDNVIENLIREVGGGKAVERAAKEGDLVEIDFAGKDADGKTLPNTDGKNMPLVLGTKQFLEDLEKAFVGMKPGEEKTGVKVKFPKDYHSPDFAGKKVPFDIKLQKVSEISASNLDEEMIEKISGKKKSIEEFKKDVHSMVERSKKDQEHKKAMNQYNEKFAKVVKVDLPESWIEKEVEGRITDLKQSPEFKHDPENFWKAIGKKEEDLRKQFKKDAELNLKVFLGLSEVVKEEKIELDKDEFNKAHHIAHHKMSQNENADHNAEMERAVLNLKIDKYFEGLTL